MRKFLPVFDPEINSAFTLGITPAEWSVHAIPPEFLFETTDTLFSVEPPEDNRAWHIAENPALTLILDGHLYLRGAHTLNPAESLEQLLHRMSVRTIEKGLEEIAGGVYNLFVVDKEHRQVWITGDHAALMPLFYMKTRNGFFCSGNAFSFRRLAALSEEALVEFLKYGYLPFAHSAFEDVRRRLPGQVFRIALQTRKVSISPACIYEYKPPEYRITDLSAASQVLHQALSAYFARLEPARYGIANPNNWSSGLLARWLQPFAAVPLEVDEHSTGEAPLSEWMETLSPEPLHRFRLMLSVEHSDIFAAEHRMGQQNDVIFVDDLLGDEVMGGEYLRYSGAAVAHPPAAPNTAIRPIPYYQNFLYHSLHALPDSVLGSLVEPVFECWFLNAARGILEVNRTAGHTHEDFIESLQFFTHARSLSAARLIGIGSHSPCLAPFADRDIFGTCLQVDSSLRHNRLLMRNYLQTHFPEWSHLHPQQRNTAAGAGAPTNPLRRTLQRLQRLWQPERPVAESPENRSFAHWQHLVESELEGPARRMPAFISRGVTELWNQHRLHPLLGLRYLSLNRYLNF